MHERWVLHTARFCMGTPSWVASTSTGRFGWCRDQEEHGQDNNTRSRKRWEACCCIGITRGWACAEGCPQLRHNVHTISGHGTGRNDKYPIVGIQRVHMPAWGGVDTVQYSNTELARLPMTLLDQHKPLIFNVHSLLATNGIPVIEVRTRFLTCSSPGSRCRRSEDN
jgi:hypothetical protein